MNSEPRPSDREVLTGLVERVTYPNAENGFCVLRVKARGHRELAGGMRNDKDDDQNCRIIHAVLLRLSP
jgi:hypothetical protein